MMGSNCSNEKSWNEDTITQMLLSKVVSYLYHLIENTIAEGRMRNEKNWLVIVTQMRKEGRRI